MRARDLGVIVLVVLGVLVLLPLFFGPAMMGGWGGHMMGHGMMGPGMMGPGMMGPGMMGPGAVGGAWYGRWGIALPLLGGLFRLLILVGLVMVVASLVRHGGRGIPVAGAESPLEVIKLRLARGEITVEQYDALKRELS